MLFKDILSALCVFFLNSEYKMSSVTRFIRQIPVNAQLHSNALLLATPTLAYEFVPAAGNVVGNYPPGAMVAASSALQTAIAAQGANALLRDMGKTVKCAGPGSSDLRYFRQVQLITHTNSSSVVGGAAGNTFGVQGGPSLPSANTSFLVFYVAVAAGDIIGAGPYAAALLCGQM